MKQWAYHICTWTQFFHSWHSCKQLRVYSLSVHKPVNQKWLCTMSHCVIVKCRISKYVLPSSWYMYIINAQDLFFHMVRKLFFSYIIVLYQTGLNQIAVIAIMCQTPCPEPEFFMGKKRSWLTRIHYSISKTLIPGAKFCFICAIYRHFFTPPSLEFPWMRAETSAYFSAGSFWEFKHF